MINILKGVWQFCSYLFWPQRRPKDYYNLWSMTQDKRWYSLDYCRVEGSGMKSLQIKRNNIIWVVCSAYILSITALVIWVSFHYGLGGIALLFILAISSLQLYKLAYEWFALHKEYCFSLVKRITNCWIIYLILDIALCTGWLFSSLFLMAENGTWGIPKLVYCIVIIGLAVLLTLKPIQPFTSKVILAEKKWRLAGLINAFVPRFVILYTFVVYYFIAFTSYESQSQIIPSLCVVYIAIERIISMFNTVKGYSNQEYYSLFMDTKRWIRERRKMD